jgi:uncharacterized protein (TIGR03067 family)
MMNTFTVIWSVTSIMFGLQPPKEAVQRELAQMQGLWRVEKAIRAGQEAPEETRSKLRLKIEGNVFTMMDEGSAREERAEVSLDLTANPRQIDIRPKRKGAEPGRGIYQLEGDTMTLCWTPEGGERPKKFASENGSNVRLLVLKRVK